ncbi:MAG: hypothetical protein LUH23_07695 [Oscillospiraceae bacterium]|nr:hypothetical protein [Oscillospiraceae bacterium]
MKRILLILTSLAVLLVLAACTVVEPVEEEEGISGWVRADSGWSYYVDGEMCTGTVDFEGVTYTFSEDGIWDGQGYLSLTSVTVDNTGETKPGIVDAIKSVDGAEEIYSGCYIDNLLSVIVSTDTEKMTEIISELYPGYIEIIVVLGDYNEAQLQATRDAIKEKISELNISCWTDTENCRVMIGTEEITDELTEFVNSLEYSGCVEIKIVGSADIVDDDETDLEILPTEFTEEEISEFCNLMDSCFGVGPGSAGSSLRSVSAAGSLLDWAEDHIDMLTEESLEELLNEWDGYDWDYEDLVESWNSVAGSINEIVSDPTDESLLGLLDDSGYTLQHESYSEDLAELLITVIGNHYATETD